MKLSISILSLFCLFCAPTLSLTYYNSKLVSATIDLKVPGDSPLQYCDEDRSKDILTVEYFNVDPNPPMPYFFPAPLSIPNPDQLTHLTEAKTAPSTQPGYLAKKLKKAPMSSCRLSSTSTLRYLRRRSICVSRSRVQISSVRLKRVRLRW
jgi:hypothetical protein